MSIFKKAKEQAEPKKGKASDEKVRINIENYGEAGEMFDKISELQDLQKQIKIKQTKADLISDEIKVIGREEWAKLFAKKGDNPGSVMLECVDGLNTAQCMFVPSDKFAGKIDEARSKDLQEKFGEEIVEEKTTYKFNSVMLEKYADIISDLISNSTEISDRDKDDIIEAEVVYSVKKGTLDKLNRIVPTDSSIKEVMDILNPVVMLRDVEVINE